MDNLRGVESCVDRGTGNGAASGVRGAASLTTARRPCTAIEDYGEAIRLECNHSGESYLVRGRALAQLGHREGAAEDFRQTAA